MRTILIILFCLFLFSLSAKNVVKNGEIFITKDMASKPFLLNGDWLFVKNQLITYEYDKTEFLYVPKSWNFSDMPSKRYGCGSYILKVKLDDSVKSLAINMPIVANSYKLFWNGAEYGSAGNPATTKKEYRPGWKPQTIFLDNIKKENILVIQTANFRDISSGLHISPVIGLPNKVVQKRTNKIFFSTIVFGALVLMAFYHFGLFFYRRNDMSTLFFALFSLDIGIRSLLYSEIVILDIINLPFVVILKSGYLTFTLALTSFVAFLHSVYPTKHSNIINKIAFVVSITYSMIIIVTPDYIFTKILIIFQIFALFIAIYCFVNIMIAVVSKKPGSFLFILGFVAFIMAALTDIAGSIFDFRSIDTVSQGVLIFIFFQSLIIAKKFSMTFYENEKYSKYLSNLNISLQRFIPKEMLSFLNKQSITEVKLGDHTEEEMTVFFIDIRDFTTLSEKMTPEDNFKFINSYLRRIGPIIHKNNGFIDKYFGDGIIALFPQKPDDAIKSALGIRVELINYNKQRATYGYMPIKVGMGIHTGKLMLGTIGEEIRMDTTVISDTVNVASRLESLTKVKGKDLLFSKETKDRISQIYSDITYSCGFEKVKGKEKVIELFTID